MPSIEIPKADMTIRNPEEIYIEIILPHDEQPERETD